MVATRGVSLEYDQAYWYLPASQDVQCKIEVALCNDCDRLDQYIEEELMGEGAHGSIRDTKRIVQVRV